MTMKGIKKIVASVAAAAVVGMGAGVVAAAPANADGCPNVVVFGNGGGQCDGPFYPDGSFQRCTSVYVLGIGGTNCYIVPPPP